ncbi:LapB repeat-containing protein [Listeria costaricensis]|uniref:LapB repeat-containing protein n=1 Tax=Listeria costaricensis TaxID=2026604 RepID=UPI000C07E4B9|nr:LapB repeat-containing protein [Listeria costaricensis]
MRKLFTLFLIAIFLFTSTGLWTTAVHADETASTATEVNIPDPALRSYLNSLLKQPSDAPITTDQMATITSVDLSGSTYTDLTGLETAVNLTYLTISNTNITTLAPIQNLTSLISLTVSGNNITDSFFPDLNGLTSLESISINSPNVTDDIFNTFNQLPNLHEVYAQNSMGITDISALASLPTLKTLFVQFDGIDDFRPLNDFESFKNGSLQTLAAYGQNTGRYYPHVSLKSSQLDYDEAAQTLYLPFSMMPHRLTSFDGTVAPFTKSTSSSNTYVGFNDQQVASSRLTITNDGITISNVTKEEFDGLTELEYNARYDFATGSYPVPSNMTSYVISSGTYDQYFDIRHVLDLTADESVDYNQYEPVTEEQFLQDVHAETDDGTPVQSDFDQVVDFNTPGEYTVTLTAENTAGLKADPVTVKVIVHAKPVITADPAITYEKDTTKSADEFMEDDHASVTENAHLVSDFDDVVDLSTPGDYTVTWTAENDRGQKADPVEVVVTVTDASPTPDPGTDTDDSDNDKNTDIVTPAQDDRDTPQVTTSPKNEQQSVTVKEKSPSSSQTTKATETEKATSNKQEALPKTGDSANWPIAVTGAMLSLAAIVLLRKRK